MRTSSSRRARCRFVIAAAVAMTLTGVAATPAHAETIREQQWHLDAMHAEEIWERSTGRGMTVAVIDSGVDEKLADLRGQVLDGADFSGLKGDEHTDESGHGTSMAALIAGTGARGKVNGSYGLAPGSKILPIRMPQAGDALDFDRLDTHPGYPSSLVKAIRFAADSEAQIINVSMGGANAPGAKNVGTPELAAVVTYALDRGKLIFAAVGNSGDTTNFVEYPAGTPGVVGVAGVDEQAKPIKKSQWGPQVDMAAPAKDIVGACISDTQLCKGTGTSNATALASASAALIWSQHPDWTNNQVLRVLMQTASGNEDGLSRDDVVGYGVVRPRIALKNPGDPGPADEYPIPDFSYADAKSSAPKPDASAPAAGVAEPAATPPTAADDSDSPTLWIAAGIGAAALLGAAIAVPALRNRRRDAVTVPGGTPEQYGSWHSQYTQTQNADHQQRGGTSWPGTNGKS
ncbi:type VII secretion-associated serine protease mycosin [Streptomyces sp. NPDC006274]|uniref:type VII secretion-associated serine protease mycosin n=1 Tax=unclassified Streptomyces TaxID=2593676 RepID=UPI0033BBBA69